MMSFFLNPWTFIAGAALVSLPIIIHLINRIRYKRVKWAAMEFLLKAQKRMRRRKILEQLILLLLRCLLIFMAGVLFARFIGCGKGEGQETRPTTHIVILDDSPSMADLVAGLDGSKSSAFNEGKQLVAERLMPAAAEATTTQTMYVLRLSDLDDPYPSKTKLIDGKPTSRSPEEVREEARINGKNITAMKDYLQTLQVSTVRRSLIDGLRKAKELFDQAPGTDARIIHVISDLRSLDWNADGQTIQELMRELKDAGITIHLIDAASPARKPDRKSPQFSDNVSIVELKPRNRVVSVNQQTEVEVRIKNYGSTDLKDVRIDFYLNGHSDSAPASIQIPTLPPNQEAIRTVQATLQRAGTKEKPLDRFNILTAALGTGDGNGLAVDNARHTVIEVRDTVKVLIVDGRTLEAGVDLRTKPEGDSYYLRTLFQTKAQELGNLEVVNGDYVNLDKIDLRPFSTIYLINVPGLNDAAVKNLERFVGEGGGVGVFLGPNIKPDDYNSKMYRGPGVGFFPVQLPDKPKLLSREELERRANSFTKRLLLRSTDNKFHAALRRIYLDDRGEVLKNDGVEPFFMLVNIDAHWPVSRRGQWRDDKSIQELYCLQNDAPVADFEGKAVELIKAIKENYDQPKFEKSRKYLDGQNGLLEKIRKVATPNSGESLAELARLLDALLCDQINTGDESEPVLRDFWSQPEMVQAKALATVTRDEAKYGNPLYLVKQFGRGRVAVMTTDAGGMYEKKQWNDWPSLKGTPGWVVIVGEMQKYLAGGGDDANRSVGDTFSTEFDFNNYNPEVSIHLLTADGSKPKPDRTIPVVLKEVGKLTMHSPANAIDAPPDTPKRPYQLKFNDSKQPGAYLFTLARKKGTAPQPGGPAGKPDQLGDVDFVGVAFNVDALAEGDLRRANTDDLAQSTNKAPLHNTEDLSWIDSFKQKPSDMSSRRWIYLVLLLLLIAEQAWAVRISYHTKPEDLEAFAPSAAAAYSHHTPLPSASGESAAATSGAR